MQSNQTTTIDNLQTNPDQLIRKAKNGPIAITNPDGTPLAVMLNINDYERLRRLVEEFDGILDESKTI